MLYRLYNIIKPTVVQRHPHPKAIRTIIVPIRIPTCLSLFCYNFCSPSHLQSRLLVLRINFLHLEFCMLFCTETRVL